MRSLTLIASIICCFAVGCGGDPEEKSGADAYRHQAQAMPLGEWVTDDISLADADRTDWRFVQIADPGKLTVEFHADEKDTGAVVAVFDRYGQPLAKGTRAAGESAPLSFEASVQEAGKVFIMVQATGGPTSSYTLRATQGEAKGGGGGVGTPDF